MKQQILTTGFVIFSFLLPLKATAASFSQLYVFGNSLSDTGNSFNATGIPPTPPYYQVFPMPRFGWIIWQAIWD